VSIRIPLRIPTPVLLGMALAAVALNAAVTAEVAVAENDVIVAMGEAGVIPEMGSVSLDGVTVAIRPDGDAYALAFTNPDDEARDVHVSVRMTETRGSMMARMMPMPTDLGELTIKATVPPRSTLVRVVGEDIFGVTAAASVAPRIPDALSADEPMLLDNVSMTYVSHDFHFLPLDGPMDAVAGQLNVDATPVAALDEEPPTRRDRRG